MINSHSRGRPSSGSGATSRPRPTSGPRTTSKPSKYNPPKKNGWVKKAVIGAGAAYVGYKVVIIRFEQSLHYILKYAIKIMILEYAGC